MRKMSFSAELLYLDIRDSKSRQTYDPPLSLPEQCVRGASVSRVDLAGAPPSRERARERDGPVREKKKDGRGGNFGNKKVSSRRDICREVRAFMGGGKGKIFPFEKKCEKYSVGLQGITGEGREVI